MNLRTPVAAMLWEQWRMTRVEAAWRVALCLAAGSWAMLVQDKGPTIAFYLLIWMNAIIWLSIAKLNGGRFMDGYKPGFPLYLLYTRPVPTSVFVGVATAYDAISGVVIYLVCAAILGYAFGQPLPLFSVVLWILAGRFLYTCVQWSIPSRSVQWGVSLLLYWPLFLMLKARVASPLQVEFSLVQDVLMILIIVASFSMTVAGVARQRRGDVTASDPRKASLAGYPVWLINLFGFRCPTTSATRAQIWFELKSSGLPILALGLALGALIAVLFAVGVVAEPIRSAAVAVSMFFGPFLLIALGGNAFGIRRKQGRSYASLFEVSQPYSTAQMAGLKILVRSCCVLAALIVVAFSVWASSSLIGAWGSWVVEGKNSAQGLIDARQNLTASVARLAGHQFAIPAILVSLAVALMVASRAAITALRARYTRRVNIAGALLLGYVLALALLVVAVAAEWAPDFLLRKVLMTTRWIVAGALAIGTAWLCWRLLEERLFSPRQAWITGLLLAAFGVTWVMLLRKAGMSANELDAAEALWMLCPVFLPLTFIVLAPWSLSRIRHT